MPAFALRSSAAKSCRGKVNEVEAVFGSGWLAMNGGYINKKYFSTFFVDGGIILDIIPTVKQRKTKFSSDVPTSVLIPEPLQRAVQKRATAEERSFSAVVRRALKKELGLPLDEEPMRAGR